MANTTFSGPVRSENNLQLISKTASTGVVHDRTQGFGLRDARRYYLYEPFLQRPGLNAINIIDPDANDATANAHERRWQWRLFTNSTLDVFTTIWIDV